MRKTCFITLIAAVMFGMMLPSCKPTEDPSNITDKVVVTTADPTFVSACSASCGAEVTAENFGLLTEIGICWSTSANPTIDNFVVKSYKCSQPFNSLLSNLEPNTQYHVRGFAKYGTAYCYGSEKTFTTLDNNNPEASPVTTLPAHDITYNSFICDITVEPFGATTWYVGVCYSRNPELEFTMGHCEGYEYAIPELVNGVYQVTLHNLLADTEYFYRAFLRYRDDYSGNNIYYYGEILSCTTPILPFVLDIETYLPDYNPGDNYMTANGGGYCTKPQLINQVGFCYSTEHEYPQYDSDFYTIAATPTGHNPDFRFSSNINDLSASTKYYVRSYVRYMADSIKYGNVVTVDTYK